jgi:uncharacterized protein
MKFVSGQLVLSATDLSNFLACRRKAALDLSVARGERERPHFDDPIVEILRKRGAEHEARYVETQRSQGLDIVDASKIDGVEQPSREARVERTLDAMRRGASRIVQAALVSTDGRWFGYADVLRRVEQPSALGAWSYEALDTKLALETRAATMLQLALYSELLTETQGAAPEFFYVVTPAAEERYRVADYAAYFRLMKHRLLEFLETSTAESSPYPDPVAHCDVCDWRGHCQRQLRADDHLSFVANCSRVQRIELASHSITTLAALGSDGLPAPFRPVRGALATYQRLQHQARLQLQSRSQNGAPVFETLPITKDLGLCLLPEPSPGDVFLDLEGATFARDGGREYLFGLVTVPDPGKAPVYEAFKAFDDAEEQRAFESVIDRLIAALDAHPGMHVYHYAPYEPAAFKKLMGRYATRAPELDRLLRGERFVDLYAVIRHALRAGVERYSIKNLEALYEFTREVDLDEAGRNRRLVEQALDLGTPQLVKEDEFQVVVGYNCDDCVSALKLRDWLERLRAAALERGDEVPRPVLKVADQVKIGELEQRARAVRQQLPSAPVTGDAGRGIDPLVLLAYTVDWHTREFKASWWEYYRLRDLPPEDQADEPMVVVGLEFLERVDVKLHKTTGKPTGTVTDRYRYADRQEMEIDEGDSLTLKNEDDWGTVVNIDRIARTMDVQKMPGQAEHHAESAFSFFAVPTETIQKAVLDFADDVVARGLDATAPDGAADPRRDLLLRRTTATFSVCPVPSAPSVLPLQGPPGTGKTYKGAQMICDLVADGRKVGVLANSHKVIRNLLKAVQSEAARRGRTVRIAHKVKEPMDDGAGILEETDTKRALSLLANDQADVLGGVAWTWTVEKAIGVLDTLFVDEAGQMSLANVLGSARAAKRLVLLGDQQQLDQPSKASHPDGVSVSALEHILAGERTMPAERGIFLPTSRRLSPAIAQFTSEAFYEGRLDTLPELVHQRLKHVSPLEQRALWVLPVEHTGNRSYSTQEVDAVAALVERLLAPPSAWVDREQREHRITPKDILVVSPYNAQVARLRRQFDVAGSTLRDVRVGTVDKFQGQEGPVVIYSMASSSAAEAPRGMEFLYSLNRLNVATSRAQCAVIIVASPSLFEPLCATPRQIQLANALARFRELAVSIPPAGTAC